MKTVTAFIRRHGVGFTVGTLLLVDILLHCADGFSGWAPTWYALSYEMGSGSRLLVGTVLRMLMGGAVTESGAVKFVTGSCVVVALLFAFLMERIYNIINENCRRPALFVMGLLTVSPFSVRYLWNESNFGRLDLFLVMALLFALLLLTYCKKRVYRVLLVGGISIIAIFIHQIFVFLFFPVLFGLLFVDIFKAGKPRFQDFLPAILCGIAVVGVFFYVQIYSKINAPTVDVLIAQLEQETNLRVSHSALDFEYFHDFRYAFEHHMLPFVSEKVVFLKLALTFVLLSPAAGILLGITQGSMRGTSFRQPYRYLPLLAFCFLPPFVLAVDWNRWIAAFFLGWGLLYLMLLSEGDPAVETGFTKLDADMKRRPLLYGGILLYLASLHTLEARMFLPEVESLMRILRSLI